MPLGYERAAGGPDTSNPLGVRADARPNTYGMVALPNLQPPGLQISGRADLTYDETMQYDIQYVNNHSLRGDLRIAWLTLAAVIMRNGAR